MSKLIEAMYPLPDYRRTPLTLLRWWESRRLLYNRVVGTAGLVTLAGIWLIELMPPGVEVLPWQGMVVGALVYGVLANLCYSMGWAAEVAARILWGADAPDLGPVLFRQGLIFSVGLTLFPLGLAAIAWVVQVVLAIL